jgi:predicted N-acetyltransferase YhbS
VNWKIDRVEGSELDCDEVVAVYRDSGLGARRPIDDLDRFRAMLANANLVVVCRVDGRMVGIARSISDFSYATYLSDIAVVGDYQRAGIGRALIDATRREAPRAKIVLLSAPAATGYYPRVGFTRHESAWVLDALETGR